MSYSSRLPGAGQGRPLINLRPETQGIQQEAMEIGRSPRRFCQAAIAYKRHQHVRRVQGPM